jgi:hydrogenase maturation protease
VDEWTVDVLLLGSRDRGDDGAALAVATLLDGQLPPRARVRRVGQLDIDDLLAVPDGGGVVVVDAASGMAPGAVLTLLLGRRFTTVQPRSSHALAIPDVVELATVIRGRSLAGRIVVIGVLCCGFGDGLSGPVAAAMPTLARTVRGAVAAVLAETGSPDTPAARAGVA